MNLRQWVGIGLVAVLGSSAPASPAASDSPRDVEQTYAGRNLYVHVPSQVPTAGTRALVIVLHGGLGNAERILSGQAERGLNLDAAADQSGFVVAYLNGTQVARLLGADKRGWNAGGGCCGLSASSNVDDVAYIRGAVDMLVSRYSIDPRRVYGIGHSNGAMMVMRMMCETDTLAAAISIAGPLNVDGEQCSAAHGKRVLGIHGELDQNVPIAGGVGPKGISRVSFKSEERTRRILMKAGIEYELQTLPGVDHFLNHIEDALQRTEGHSIAQKAARYFGLEGGNPR
jgi:polyhydroxybutyrate depolymerase